MRGPWQYLAFDRARIGFFMEYYEEDSITRRHIDSARMIFSPVLRLRDAYLYGNKQKRMAGAQPWDVRGQDIWGNGWVVTLSANDPGPPDSIKSLSFPGFLRQPRFQSGHHLLRRDPEDDGAQSRRGDKQKRYRQPTRCSLYRKLLRDHLR